MKSFPLMLCLVLQSVFIQAGEPSPRVAYTIHHSSENESGCLPKICHQDPNRSAKICVGILLVGAATILATNAIVHPRGSSLSNNSTTPILPNNQTASTHQPRLTTPRAAADFKRTLKYSHNKRKRQPYR